VTIEHHHRPLSLLADRRNKEGNAVTGESGDWLEVAEALAPTVIPERGPKEYDGFRFATVFDGVDDARRAVISAERGQLEEADERQRVLDYLAGGAVVVDSSTYGVDVLEPTRRYAVPATRRTDGTYVWSAAVEYYLRWHHVAPEPDFYRHIVAHGYAVPTVGDEVVRAARAATMRHGELVRQQERDWLDAQGLLRRGDESRFSPQLDLRLLELGWFRGRDVRDRVDRWLAAHWRPDPPSPHPEEEEFPAYEPLPAALRVLYEFGGIGSNTGGAGITAAKTPFAIFPVTGDEDLEFWRGAIQALGGELEIRLFQVGQVERGLGALAVAEDGGVYLVGPANLYAGKDIDEALHRLLDGIKLDLA
jgi:hypothetical protein